MPYYLNQKSNVCWFNETDDPIWFQEMKLITDDEAKVILARLNNPSPASSCTPAQGLIALFTIKKITEQNILDAIARMDDPAKQYIARIGYQHATTWDRGSPTMAAMAQLLMLSEKDLDDLFTHAATVQV